MPPIAANSGPPVWWEILADVLIIVGTLSVAVLAVWGAWFRQKLAGPRLQIEGENLRGTVVDTQDGKRLIYYHLRVRNKRRWSSAKNCRVMLRKIERKGPDGRFHPVRLPVPLQFVWAPAGFTPLLPAIADQQVLDFGYIAERSTEDRFIPTFYVTTNDFDGYVRPKESLRYHLQALADDFASAALTVVEVAWDGTWSDNLDEMERHIRISLIAG